MTLELTDAGHRFELVTPEGLVQRILADHPEVYPTHPEPTARRTGGT